jgi:hypothetical protein
MRSLLLVVVWLGLAVAAAAQQAPFDMSPERPTAPEEPSPAAPPPSPAAPDPTPAQPPPPPDSAEPGLPEMEAEAPPPQQQLKPFRRHLLPDEKLVLSGEQARRGWVFFLTAAQAASPATLHLAYQNAIVVAPESSQLRISLNGTAVHEEEVHAADGVENLSIAVPAGVLRPGRNEIALLARHRHRTDCTIESTYELWTEITGAGTYLAFDDPAARVLRTTEDLAALGGDASGKAHLAIVAPALARFDIAPDVMRLSQAIARLVNVPDIEFSVSAAPPTGDDLQMIVALGTYEDLASLGEAYRLPQGGAASTFAGQSAGDVPIFVVSGRDRSEWAAALDQIVASVDRPAGVQRDVIATEAWRTPNAPMIFEQRRIPFSEMGIRSEQFSGRRYTAEFEFGVPSDFYADAYGQASILLDAAYSDRVLPGSLLNVYVNGNIAASVPVTTTRGAVLSRFPIRVTMRHFRPGLNSILLEAELRTEADEDCAAGASADETPRFALFDTSQFVMPDFGRIAQRPNLAALSGTAFPYNRADAPVAVIGRTSEDVASAYATLLGRMARAAARILKVEFVSSPDALGGRDAIVIGAVADIPASLLTGVGISPDSRDQWGSRAGGGNAGPTLDDWRRQVTGSWFTRIWRDFTQWTQKTFNITGEMLRFAPQEDEDFTPSPAVGLLVAQRANPAGTGAWTVFAAPDETSLRSGMSGFVEQRNWSRLSGRLTTFTPGTGEVTALPVGRFGFVETVPGSVWNYRLVAANWLSANILSYSLILIVACGLLGAATTLLLSHLGRRR